MYLIFNETKMKEKLLSLPAFLPSAFTGKPVPLKK